MQRLQAFKYELMPNGGQQRDMRRFAGACRFVFNKALAWQQANHAAGAKFMNYVALANKLPDWKQEFQWLKQAPSQALQQVLKDLERAYKNFFEKKEKRLAKYQQRMNRKLKFSKNWHKAKCRVQKVHTQIANARKDFLHKKTAEISKIQLAYKLDWNGGMLIAVAPQYTSQTCPCCGYVAKANRKTQAKFECVECGYANNADVVGAMNILARGYRVTACGEDGSGSVRKNRTKPALVKQEPTEATRQEATYV